jgi:hypothetical protein
MLIYIGQDDITMWEETRDDQCELRRKQGMTIVREGKPESSRYANPRPMQDDCETRKKILERVCWGTV